MTKDEIDEALGGAEVVFQSSYDELLDSVAALFPKPKTYPLKPIELKITVNGHNWEEVLRALDERVATVHERREQAGGCSASGYGASHTCDIMLRDVTLEQFVEESIAWLEAQPRPAP
jgi:hypothetical protein